MRKTNLAIMLASGAAILTAAGAAFAATPDRAPTAEERAAIERVLSANGFVSWEEIELDSGRWEIDDAVTHDGSRFDVKLAPDTLRVIRRTRDD